MKIHWRTRKTFNLFSKPKPQKLVWSHPRFSDWVQLWERLLDSYCAKSTGHQYGNGVFYSLRDIFRNTGLI